MKEYRCPEIAQLVHELGMSPTRHRIRQLSGAARALELIDPSKDYPYSFICFQITGYHPRRTEESVLHGKDLALDIATLMDVLSAATPLPSEAAAGALYDSDSLARRFNVSRKTISRWRLRGLAGCWYRFADGKPRLAFSSRGIERFVARNGDLVRRGASFQLMRSNEKETIVARARELVASERLSLHAVTIRLAEETGRAVETLRYTLRRFDRENPSEALFDRIEQAQEVDENQLIFDAFTAGDSVSDLAARFSKRESDIRRIVTAVRASQLIDKAFDYVYNEEFDAPGAERLILRDGLDDKGAVCDESDAVDATLVRVPDSVPAYLRELYRTPLLSRTEESCLFRRMNFLRHLAEMARQRLAAAAARPSAELIAKIDGLLDKAHEAQNAIIQANLRLVVSIAKRHARGPRAACLFELVSDGNIALMRAVDKFDYARGFRFSTYASWAITRHFARTIPEEYHHGDRFQTGHEEVLTGARDYRDVEAEEVSAERRRDVVAVVLRTLDTRERSIVERHYGLTGTDDAGCTLEEIGREFGISKERVRQIEQRALRKLRSALGDGALELMAG